MSKKSIIINEKFSLYTAIISGIIGVLYFWKGFLDGFTISVYILIISNLLFIPFAIFFKKNAFPFYYLFYSFILIFVLATEKTYLYNNYSPLFILCIVFMKNPKLKRISIILYFVGIVFAFAISKESLCHFFLHLARSCWLIYAINFTLSDKFQRKNLILYDDEKEILSQLCNGKIYQKEVTGYSENTIYRKLKAARERNGNIYVDLGNAGKVEGFLPVKFQSKLEYY